jgi:hypothetical protein
VSAVVVGAGALQHGDGVLRVRHRRLERVDADDRGRDRQGEGRVSRLPGPRFAWYAAATVAALYLVYHLLVVPARRSAAAVAGAAGEGLAPDVAAALSGQPSVNASPVDQLSPHVLEALGVDQYEHDTIGTRMARAAASIHYEYTQD